MPHVCNICTYVIVAYTCQQEGGDEDGKENDYPVTVIDTSTGKKLTGEQAPLKSELEKWLQEHPK